MLPTEDLFVYVYVPVDDAVSSRAVAIAPRPGPPPACTDPELLAIALVRHLLGRRSEAGFLAEVARDWAHLFPELPHQSQASRRIRWLWGAFEQLRAMLAARLPADDCQQAGTTALLVSTPPGSAAGHMPEPAGQAGAAPSFACEMRARPALAVLAWAGDGSPVRGCTTTSGVQVPPRTLLRKLLSTVAYRCDPASIPNGLR
jgi:hypothetical protein